MTQAPESPLGSNSRSPLDGDPRIAFFDRLADQWDHDEQDPLDTIRRVGEQAELLGLQPGEDVLEVGCGTGQLTGWLVEQVRPARVVALDFSAKMLKHARAKAIDAEFRHLDVCSDAPGESSFDVVLCFHSFPHYRDQAAALKNLAGALKPGGRLLVMHLNSSADVNAFHDSVGGHVTGDHLPSADAWPDLLATAGLKQTELIDQPGLFFLRAERL